MDHNPWKIIDEQEIYNNPWIRLTQYNVINPGGGKGIYGKVHFKNTAVGVMVLDEQLNTYLVGQYRFTLNAYSWEIPEGGGPIGTNPLESGKRELLEETGLIAQKWEALFYLARQLKQDQPRPEETEQLVVKKIPFMEAVEMVENGQITDSMSVAAIYKVQLLLAQGKLK
ncbi:MAG: hypothetical protein FD183_305 [Chitinophagaceae bacterium]|nr:MAG: hypothetical protein FD183_305 [Chitinophagaceae bacterium]